MSNRVNITSPVGRIVMGSLYDPQTTDADGKPLVIKNGPNAGQLRSNYFVALAIPKGAEQHWSQTPWGQIIWGVGHQAFPQAAQSPSFAWKIQDGDSAVPNTKGKAPRSNEGFPGHWVLMLSGGYAPKVYQADGGGWVQMMEKDAVKCGYYVEVAFNVEGNGSQQKPGVYLNHSMFALRGFGPEIVVGPDVASAGFGAAPVPAGASTVPVASAAPMPAPAAYAPPPAVAYTPPPPVAAPAGIPVIPNAQFVQVPPPVIAPPMPPAAPVRQMTAAAGGASYEAMITAGWTDALLVQHGMMIG